MSHVDLLAFAVTMAVGQLTPGPDMLLILKNTLNHGLSRGLQTIAGICTGIVLHLLAVYAGVAVLFQQAPLALRAVQVIGAAYLMWIAWQLWRASSAAALETTTDRADVVKVRVAAFRQGLLTNLSNVKVLVLFSSLLAPLADPVSGLPWRYGLIIFAQAAILWPLFAWLMQRPAPRRWFERHTKPINRVFGVLLALFAVRLLLPA